MNEKKKKLEDRKDLESFKEGGMLHGTAPQIFEAAKQLRNEMTAAEQLLWQFLKLDRKGLKFRRQHAIGIYVADFYCHKAKLVIELDGSVHDNPEVAERDAVREKDLKEWGYTIIRFNNKEVFGNVESVVNEIRRITNEIIKSNHNNQ
ncbi:endonuclease domain-containing protein [Phnomibacter ginsenosidimutans]|nr:endonuclease domain-containing protein [Phnomibacter ginsenosidimutans]